MHRFVVLSLVAVLAATAEAATPASSPALKAPVLSAASITDASQLAQDTTALDSAIKANSTPAQIAPLAAKVNADATQLAVDSGVAAQVASIKGHIINVSIGGAASVNVAFPGSTTAAGGGGGFLADVGFGLQPDGSDHWHVSAAVLLNSLTQSGKTTPAVTAALLTGFQPSAASPLLGLGPALTCPTSGQTRCLAGLAFTSGFAAVVHQFSTGS